jgi:hypothetical protein
MTRYLHKKRKEASERGRRRANIRWERDRERRERLAEMEKERRENLVVVLRDNRTGSERVFPWGPNVGAALRHYAEVMTEW